MGNLSYLTKKLSSFWRYLNFSHFFGHVGKRFDKKVIDKKYLQYILPIISLKAVRQWNMVS